MKEHRLHIWNQLLLLSLLSFNSQIVWAEKGLQDFGVSYQSYNSAGEYSDQRFGFRYLYPPKESLGGGFNILRNYRRLGSISTNSLYLMGGVQADWNSISYTFMGGVHQFSETYNLPAKDQSLYSLFVKRDFKDRSISAELGLWQDMNFIKEYVESPLDPYLQQHGARLAGTWGFTQSWQGELEVKWIELSDHNLRQDQRLQVKFDFPNEDFNVVTGLGVSRKRYSEQNLGYWSPQEYFAFGPEVEVTLDRKTAWLYKLKFKVVSEKESNYSQHFGNSSQLFVHYQTAKELALELTYTVQNSKQLGQVWWSSDLQGQLIYLF